MIDIKDISGKVLKSVLETSDCRINEELMSLCFISLSWDDDNDMTLPEGSYIERNGEKYQLLEPYNPSFISENAFRYTPVFYDRIALWSKKPCFLVTDSGEETDWSMTAYPGQFMDVIIRALSKYVGETYTYSVDASIAQSTMEYIAFQNKSIFDALTDIANAWESEWWVEGTVIHLSKCQYGDPVVLSVGESTGVPSVTNNKDGYFTRFYAFGSTKNITQDYNDGGFTNGLVNKRLTLNPDKYPGGYIDIRPDLKNDEVFVKTLTFDNIFPSSNLEIVDVRAELREYLDSDGNKIQIGESADGDPLYKQYAIWYFKISDFEFNNSTYDKDENPEGMLLPGLDLSVIFESGQLNSRDFKLTYHADTKEYEIHFIEESGSIIIPGTVSSIPANGDKIVLYNIRMPQEYTLSAQDDLEEALLSEMAKYAKDLNTYTVPSNPVYFNANGLDLNVGQSVTFMFGSRMLSTRVLKVEKRLDYPIEQTITIGEKKIKGNTQEIKEEVIDANQNIDVVKALADLNKAITDGYGRVQQLIIQSMSQYKGMWVLNQNGHPDDPSYWTVETDFQAISRKSLVAYGDVIAKSVDEEIEDAELPKAGIGLYNFGIVAFKQDGGILIDSNGLAYVDPSFAGGGGLDIEQLEQYLTTSGYLKKNDPATSLLMTGYVKAGAYSPIQATDNLSVAIGKLEKHFDDYVTLATAQTITGAKIFTQDVISQGDIIAKSTSEAISDAELPIASKTQLGLIKVGSGFEITADGTINNTGGGGLTEVYWDDIKGEPPFANKSHTHTKSQITDFPTYWSWNYISGKPSTFAPSYHTHTIANITDIGNASVLEAYRLSNIRYFWGQPFNGQYDVDGSMSSVTNITMSGNLAVGVSSAQAKVHVNGDGLFTGDLICKSTSTAISDAELPVATSSTLGLIKIGSTLRISNGVVDVAGGSGGGSNVYWGSATSNMVPLYVDDTYYELARNNHAHDVSTSGTGNAVTGVSFSGRTMTLTKGSTFSLYNHNHAVSNSGSGNAVTSISFSGGTLTATKGSTFSLNGHTHSQYITGLTRSTSGSGNVVTDVTVSGSRVTVYYGNASGSSTASSLATRVYTGGTTFSDGGSLGVYISGGNGIEGRNGASRGNLYLNYSSSTTNVGIDARGNLKATSTGTYSDLRLKTIVKTITGVLDTMMEIPVIEYFRKDLDKIVNRTGFGAQSFIGRFNTCVELDDMSGYYMINETGILAVTFQGVKELYTLHKQSKSEIDLLKQRIALLEAENQNLWNIINEKEAA